MRKPPAWVDRLMRIGYCFIVATYRIVPRCAPTNLETLASKARALFIAGRSALRS